MKKISLFIICLIAFMSGAFAQNPPQPLQLSFTVNPTVNWLNSDKKDVKSTGLRAGFDFGLISDFFFDQRQRYAITTGVLFNITGGEFKYGTPVQNPAPIVIGGESISMPATVRFNLQYLEVPFAVKLKTGQFRRNTYWGQFGLSSAFNISSKGNSSDGALDKTNIFDEIRTLNMSLNIGLGFDYDIGWGNALTFGILYKNGFSDLTKKDQYDGKVNLNSLVLRMGLVF